MAMEKFFQADIDVALVHCDEAIRYDYPTDLKPPSKSEGLCERLR